MSRCRRSLAVLLLLAAAAAFGVNVSARQMPDPKRMSGVPLPVADLPVGTVTVRVLRGSLTNPIASQTVEIAGAGAARTAVTNDAGRAEFAGIPVGARIRAVATIGGTRLESQEFPVPASGGVRLMLVAADGGAAAPDPAGPPAAAAVPGTVALGDESRFVFETGEDGLSVFYILQIVNAGTSPVDVGQPVVFELPAIARNASVLEGSSPQASVAGRQLKIAGPFPPGSTLVQAAYTVPYTGANLDIQQPLPLALGHLAVVAQKVGDMRLLSPQIAEQRDMPAQGNLYIAGRGGAVKAGETLQFNFSGMPHPATWPRTLAIGLALLVLGTGAWHAVRAGSRAAPEDARRQELEAGRDRLFEELTALELRYRDQAIDPERYHERRRELIVALERIYVALDDAAAVSQPSST